MQRQDLGEQRERYLLVLEENLVAHVQQRLRHRRRPPRFERRRRSRGTRRGGRACPL